MGVQVELLQSVIGGTGKGIGVRVLIIFYQVARSGCLYKSDRYKMIRVTQGAFYSETGIILFISCLPFQQDVAGVDPLSFEKETLIS